MNSRHDHRFMRCMAAAWLSVAAGLLSTATHAQEGPVLIVLSAASAFEGHAGTKVLKLPVNFNGTNGTTVTGTVSAVPLSGSGFNAATGGTVCGAAAVDFVPFSNVAFSIPPNTPNGTLYIGIQLCGDTVIEPNEHILVTITTTAGAYCLAESCTAIGSIIDDDGPPTMSVNNISTSEPVIGSKTATFTVRLSHPSSQQISVNYRTRNGTARAPCFDCLPPVSDPDYHISSGTLLIPPETPSGPILVTVLSGGSNEPDENFFVDLSAPVNATIAAGGGTGRATIHDTTLSVGGFDLSPDNARVRAGEMLTYHVDWTVPAHQVWRNLKTIDFRIRGAHGTLLWLRWDEASNKFSLCRKAANAGGDHDGHEQDDDSRENSMAPAEKSKVVCSSGELPGSQGVLTTSFGKLYLADSTVLGSGPTGQRVSLQLALSLGAQSAGHAYRVELAASDDFGNEDSFVQASKLSVEKTELH